MAHISLDSPVFTALLLEPFLEPQMYMNLVFLIFLLVSLLPGYHFNAEDSLKAIESEQCTSIYGTPTMFTDILACQRTQKRNVSSVHTGNILEKKIFQKIWHYFYYLP